MSSYMYIKRNSGNAVCAGVCADARREGEQSAPGGPGGQRARAEDGRVRRASARGQQHQQVRSSALTARLCQMPGACSVALEAMTRPRSSLCQILPLLGSLLCASEQTTEYFESTAGNA